MKEPVLMHLGCKRRLLLPVHHPPDVHDKAASGELVGEPDIANPRARKRTAKENEPEDRVLVLLFGG